MNSNLIVYPTDFSICAKNAMAYVIAMAKALKCKIKIVHFVDVGSEAETEESPKLLLERTKILETLAEEKLLKLRAEIEDFNLECDYEIIQRNTFFLKDYLENLEPLMIVMGTVGKNNFENKLFGSLASKVIRNTESIVLVVPEKAIFNDISKIVFASDFHSKDATHIEFMRKITKYYAANLRVIHICENSANIEEEKSFLSKLEKETSKIISSRNLNFELLVGDNKDEKLLFYIENVNPDILGLVTRKRNFIERIFNKSLSKKMVNHTNTPVLVFP
ncbi:universal stress protein [Aestuariivivens sediminis]|uniref:universal stress protein n=1 Tax=Aestuariivivens sediminis TaxID=2913557 RepID=UPI001F5893C8|nr:universal stress protein [Aestuariivivens sediminis]